MEWLYGIAAASGLGLLSWILIEVVGLKIIVKGYDFQIGRLVSDAESEKETRKRLHASFEARLLALERKQRP